MDTAYACWGVVDIVRTDIHTLRSDVGMCPVMAVRVDIGVGS